MKQQAFVMKLKPGCLAEYRRRHDEISDELLAVHSEHGIRDYSIFCDEATGTLFAVRRLTGDNTVDALRQEDCIRRWWERNIDLMECRPDCEPVARDLTLVFHMD